MRRVLRVIGPGMLVAATGVGAGDLATAGFAGSRLGLAIAWAVVLGALMKWLLNEGLARHQLATGHTILESALSRGGRIAQGIFLLYLTLFAWFVGAALMSAAGAATHALIPVFDDPVVAKRIFGVACSAAGLAIARLGGFRVFERLMAIGVAVMFLSVIATAVVFLRDPAALLAGLTIPRIPDVRGEGLRLTVALAGGVGGTVTILCYGHWMREEGRTDPSDTRTCRIDLAAGYIVTALFGLAMLILAAGVPVSGRGVELIVDLSRSIEAQLTGPLGAAARWVFLIGAWAAIFSSLLGVWQAVPYLFADVIGITQGRFGPVDRSAKPYRLSMLAIATIPAIGLFVSTFRQANIAYAICGAAFLPALAVALLLLNRTREVGARSRNRWWAITGLSATLAMFLLVAAFELASLFSA